MPEETPLVRLLADAAGAIEKWCGGWYLFGARAVGLWCRPRLTTDVDLSVRLRLEDAANLWHEMESRGFRLRVSDPESFVARARVLPFFHVPTQLSVDIVLAGPGIEDRFFERAVRVKIGGIEVPVATPEDLIVMKILAGRPKDLEDVRTILKERLAKLDLTHVRSMLDLLEKALDQSDLLPVLEAEIARARRFRAGP